MRNLFLLALASAFSLVACTDRQADIQADPNESRSLESLNMLVFDDAADLFNTIEDVSKMSESELTAFESSNNYTSIGRKSDEFYNNIDFEVFQTQEEMLSFVDANRKYVSLVKYNDELSTEPFLAGNGSRYIANEDGMFAIKDTVYKVLEDGFVSTSKSNIAALTNLDSKNFSSVYLDNRLTFAPFVSESNTRIYVDKAMIVKRAEHTMGRDRIVMKIECFGFAAAGMTSYELSVCASPQKKVLGVWHATSRTITYNFYVAGSAPNLVNKMLSESGTKSGNRVEYILYGGMRAPSITISEYHCMATTPSVDFNYASISY